MHEKGRKQGMADRSERNAGIDKTNNTMTRDSKNGVHIIVKKKYYALVECTRRDGGKNG